MSLRSSLFKDMHSKFFMVSTTNISLDFKNNCFEELALRGLSVINLAGFRAILNLSSKLYTYFESSSLRLVASLILKLLLWNNGFFETPYLIIEPFVYGAGLTW